MMAKRTQTAPEPDFGFVAPEVPEGIEAPKGETRDVFDALLKGDPEANAQREAVSEELAGSLEEEFRLLAALRRRRDETKEVAAQASQAYEAQRARMSAAMEHQGTKQFKSASGLGQCSRSEQYTAKIQDPEAFVAWAQQNAPEILSVHSATLVRFVRENYRDRGIPADDPTFPPGIEVGERTNLTVTVPKQKD